MGQKKAWIWAGVVFGLIHILNDYVLPLMLGGEVVSVIIEGSLTLIVQIINGWFQF
jgi:hypothetical protein